MRDTLPIAVICCSLTFGLIAPLRAQSLADIARKEEERRKTIPQPAKVYTNKDLAPAPASSTPPPTVTETPTDAKGAVDGKAPADKAKDAAAKEKAANGTEPVKDKAYWAGRLKTLQEQLDRNQTYADALQSRINGLTADFVNRDDPAQRAVIERDRLKSIAELGRLKQAIQDDKKTLADFNEEARRAGVPPGWLR